MRKVRVVTANTYEGYGAEIALLGIADNQRDLNTIISSAKEEYGEALAIQVNEVAINEPVDEYLCGYYE